MAFYISKIVVGKCNVQQLNDIVDGETISSVC